MNPTKRLLSATIVALILALAVGGIGGALIRPRLDHLFRSEPRPSRLEFPTSPERGFFPEEPGRIHLPEQIDEEWLSRVRGALRETLHVPEGRRVLTAERISAPPLGDQGSAAGAPTADWYRLELDDGQRLRVALVRPTVPPRATIVALHGHGNTGVELLFDPRRYQHAIASELAAAGFTVIAIETRSFGGSRVGELSHSAYVQRLRLQEREFHGEVLADNTAVLTWAASRGVDLDELGVVGCSMGGVSALFLATSDSRVDAALMSGSSGSWRHSFSSVKHCSCSAIAGLLTRLDWLPLVAASHAGVVAIEGGARDEILGLSNVGDELAAYRTLDRLGGPRTVVVRHEGSHEHDPRQVVQFFREAFDR